MKETMDPESEIFVKSHVARDLLQNAALFSHEKSVVWEYVSNGLQYVNEGTNPVVKVKLDSKSSRIIVTDNGRGMDWQGLQNFFVMHGENIDRKQGKVGRGMFGTGKSAAFGIADVLRITTVQKGKRSKVELTREAINAMTSEDPIPVKIIEKEVPTTQQNGTMVEIENIHLKSLHQADVIHYIEHHLAKWRNATVFINNHECEVTPPPAVDTRVFRTQGDYKNKLGDVELVVRIAGSPLDSDACGITVYADGNWHETTMAGIEGREMSQYIFGEIDVPKLNQDQSAIPPFDLSRSMKLNRSNELVQAIFAFVGQNIDQVRRELVKIEKERKATEEAKHLAKQAESIAAVINDDFQEFVNKLAKAKAKGKSDFDFGSNKGQTGKEADELAFGSEEPAEIISQTGNPGSEGGRRTGGEEPRNLFPQVIPSSLDAERTGRAAGGKGHNTTRRGGFSVEFKHMGPDDARAYYESNIRTIFVNLDHPQLDAARGNESTETPVFLRLAYEVAFCEYCIALTHELDQQNEYIDTSDPIVAIRENINRVARKAAHLYVAK
jgi:hypothetical protein